MSNMLSVISYAEQQSLFPRISQKVWDAWPSKKDSISFGYINDTELTTAESLATTLTKVMSGLRKALSDKISINQEEKV